MKTIITSSGSDLKSLFDKRFGRSAWYCLYNEETETTEFFKNNNVDIVEGAGEKAVNNALRLKAQKIISGDFGSKVRKLLDNESIQMVVIQDSNITIQEIIDMIK